MERIKKFEDFIKESYLEDPSDVDVLNHSKKKMKKNGYTEVIVIEPVEGLEKDETVLVSATEFGQLEDDSMVTCYTDDNDEIIIPKKNLQIKA